MVPSHFIDEVVSRVDILHLVGQYVTLKQRGRDYWGLCPFHLEQSPSFHVIPERKFFKCFGCGKGGGAINFLMEMENLRFLEAVEQLAREVGLEMPQQTWEDRQHQMLRDKIFDINKKAAKFYISQLQSPEGQMARQYLEHRGLTRETLLRFAVGYAPDRWQGLIDHMRCFGFTVDDLLEAGLAKRHEKGHVYDRFRQRVMFPIVNISREVIGFGGRILGVEEKGVAKYLNSPDTVVFDKSRNLYGINFAKTSRGGAGILTEGYLDAIALHQAGFDQTVASLGTAFTERQAQLLGRYFKKSIIAYDSDKAGVSATNRAIPLLEKAGLSVSVLQLKDAKDPDEYIKNSGRGAFANLLEQSEHHLDYRLSQMKKQFDLDDVAGRVEFLQEIAKFLATVESSIEREIYADKAAEVIGISPEAVLVEIGKEMSQNQEKEKKQVERQRMQSRTGGTEGAQAREYENVRLEKAEEGLLCVLSLEPTFFRSMEDFTDKDFLNPVLGKLFVLMKERYFQGQAVEVAYLTEHFSTSEMNYLVSVVNQLQDLSNLAKAKEDYLRIIEHENELMLCSGEEALFAMQQLIEERKALK